MSLTPGLHHAKPTCFSWKFQLAEPLVKNGMIMVGEECAYVSLYIYICAHECAFNRHSTSLTSRVYQAPFGFYETSGACFNLLDFS